MHKLVVGSFEVLLSRLDPGLALRPGQRGSECPQNVKKLGMRAVRAVCGGMVPSAAETLWLSQIPPRKDSKQLQPDLRHATRREACWFVP